MFFGKVVHAEWRPPCRPVRYVKHRRFILTLQVNMSGELGYEESGQNQATCRRAEA